MRREWEGFITARGTGAIDGNGNAVPAKDRRPVGTRVVEIDLVWLKAVLNGPSAGKSSPGTGCCGRIRSVGSQSRGKRTPGAPWRAMIGTRQRVPSVTRSRCGFGPAERSSSSGPTCRRYRTSRTGLPGGFRRSASSATRTSSSHQHRAPHTVRFAGLEPPTRRAARGPLRSRPWSEPDSNASSANGRESGQLTSSRHPSIRHAPLSTGSRRSGFVGPSGLPAAQAQGGRLASVSPAVGHGPQTSPAYGRGRGRRVEVHADPAQVLPAAGRGDYA